MADSIIEKKISKPMEGSPKNILALLVVFIPVSLILIFSLSVLYYGTPEFRVDKTQHGLMIGKVQQPLNPVQTDDLIVSINSVHYSKILSFLLSSNFSSKNQTRIVIKRHGKLIEFEPKLNPVSPLRFLSIAWPHLLLMFVLISLGALSYWRVTTDQPAFLFLVTLSFFAATLSATFPSYFGILDPHIISLSFFTLAICNWVAFGACLHFVFSFPIERNLIKNKKQLIFLFYLTAPLVSIAISVILAENMDEFWGWLQRFRNIGLPFIVALAFFKQFMDYHRVSSSLEKNQIKLIISAYWLSFGPYILFYAIPNILFNDPIISFRWVVISGIILPAAYFMALIQYRLLDVDKMISRMVSYLLLVGFLLILHSCFMVVLKRVFMGREVFSEELFLVYMITIAIFFEPANRLISWFLDKIFIPQTLYRYEMMPSLSRTIGSSVTLEALVLILTKTIPKDFHVKHLVLMVFDGATIKIYPKHHDLETIPLDINLIKTHFSSKTEYLFCNPLNRDLSLKNELKSLQSAGIELVFALRGGKGVSGLLLLDSREDGRSYTRRDVQFFTTISHQAGLALENAFHYESLIESKKQMENRLTKAVQSEKMAALGEAATILAHEFQVSAQDLNVKLEDNKIQQERLDEIMGKADGLEFIINNMKGLTPGKPPQLTPINLYAEMTSMIDQWIDSNKHHKLVSIRLIPPPKTLEVLGDFKQLRQVFLNCIVNGEEAMPQGGEITISMDFQPDETICIQIRDTGPGIPEENLGNAFKYFFTTKEKGMGIGLSVCKQIVLAHKGHISIENMEQGGFRVMIHLPQKPWQPSNIPIALNPL